MALNEIYNYLQLTDHLATAGQPSEAQLAEVAQAGCQLVINLARTGQDYSLPDEASTVLANGMEYIHIPVIWEAPTRTNLENFMAVMQANHGRRVFLHCAANMRVSAFVALDRILRLGWTREQAFADMQRIWNPDARWKDFIEGALSLQS
ncbi:MAG: protein tyrosine phosphatase family protein [Anaerolineales bacterium]|nr:protein tyrosine phosphatase family protein [Anaerolineales bacterium]